MTNINDVSGSIINATFDVWAKFIWLIPTLVVAILVVLTGWMIAIVVGKFFEKILEKMHINKAADEIGIGKALEEIGIKNNISKFLGETIKWFLGIAFFLAAANILGLTQVSQFLNDILMYLPNLIAAILIIAMGVFLANVLNKAINKSAKISGSMSPSFLGNIAKWAILVFAVMAALVQLQVAQRLIETLFTGFIMMVALAGGLAFGLGGKDKAKEILDQINRK